MAARIVSRGQNRGFAAARTSAMSLALAYQRALASANAAASPDFAAWRISTAIVMWSCSGLLPGRGHEPGGRAVGQAVRRSLSDQP